MPPDAITIFLHQAFSVFHLTFSLIFDLLIMDAENFTLFCASVVDVQSIDNDKRLQAETYLTQLRNTQPTAYIVYIIQFLKSTAPEYTIISKKFLCTQLRNSLIESSVTHSILKAFDDSFTGNLIQELTSMFLDQSLDARLSIPLANCIAQLGSSLLTLSFPTLLLLFSS